MAAPTPAPQATRASQPGRPPSLRALAIRSVTGAWHAGVDLGRAPSALAFVLYDRLRARSSADGGAQPTTCAELYPFVRHAWQVEALDLSDCRDWLANLSLDALSYVLSLHRFTLIGCTRVGDAGMGFLRAQRALTDLDVSWCSGLSDGVLPHIAHLAGTLRSLNLTGTAITDAGIASVLQISSLRRLGLGSTAVTDLALDYLTYDGRYPAAGQHGLRELEWLSLASTCITEVGLLKLCALQSGVVLTKLRLLVLSSTPRLTGRAVNEVRLKYKFIAPLPNTPRTLASTNRDAMLGESWLTRISPADDRRASASRPMDGRPSEANWVDEGLKHYVHRYTLEAAAQRRAQPAPEPLGAKRKCDDMAAR